MSDLSTASVESFMEGIKDRNPGQPEFHQAVHEVICDILPFIRDKRQYAENKVLERLTEPDRVVIFRVSWEDDDGVIHVNRGYRVQHNNAIGPYKGGLRFHPSVTQGVLKFLAFEQTFKNSLTGLPMGGGKGGSDFDPKGKSDREVMRFCQAFMSELHRHIGPSTDIPAGDIGVGAREISYLFGQYLRLENEFVGVLTGKGLAFGGSLIRVEATGYGCVYFMQDMLKHTGDSIDGKTCVVSGAGNVAQYTIEKLNQLGGKVVTASDSSGFILDKNGIDEQRLAFIKELKNERRGRISEYAERFDAEYHEGKRPWGVPCDLAFPCATQNEISLEDAKQLVQNGCKAVSEGANMPTVKEGVDLFLEHKLLFGPAKAANAGGVAVSGLEMTQNEMRLSWTRDEVDSKLRDIMQSIHDKCTEDGETDGGFVNYVKGANIAGFKKVADAMVAYGVV